MHGDAVHDAHYASPLIFVHNLALLIDAAIRLSQFTPVSARNVKLTTCRWFHQEKLLIFITHPEIN